MQPDARDFTNEEADYLLDRNLDLNGNDE